jgi:hypothetical protein
MSSATDDSETGKPVRGSCKNLYKNKVLINKWIYPGNL